MSLDRATTVGDDLSISPSPIAFFGRQSPSLSFSSSSLSKQSKPSLWKASTTTPTNKSTTSEKSQDSSYKVESVDRIVPNTIPRSVANLSRSHVAIAIRTSHVDEEGADICIMDVKTGQRVGCIPELADEVFASMPNGNLICSHQDGIRVWDVTTDAKKPSVVTEFKQGAVRDLRHIAAISNTCFVTASGIGVTDLSIWDMKSAGRITWETSERGPVRALIPFLVSEIGVVTDSHLSLYPVVDNQNRMPRPSEFNFDAFSCLFAAWHPRGVVTASFNKIELLDIKMRDSYATELVTENTIRSLASLFNGDIATGHSDGTIRIWTMNDAALLCISIIQVGHFNETVCALSASCDGQSNCLAYVTGANRVGMVDLPGMRDLDYCGEQDEAERTALESSTPSTIAPVAALFTVRGLRIVEVVDMTPSPTPTMRT